MGEKNHLLYVPAICSVFKQWHLLLCVLFLTPVSFVLSFWGWHLFILKSFHVVITFAFKQCEILPDVRFIWVCSFSLLVSLFLHFFGRTHWLNWVSKLQCTGRSWSVYFVFSRRSKVHNKYQFSQKRWVFKRFLKIERVAHSTITEAKNENRLDCDRLVCRDGSARQRSLEEENG